MKRSRSKIVLIILSFAALAVAFGGAFLLFVAMEREYDATIHHFNYDAVFALSALAACVGGFLLAVAGFCIPSKKLVFADKAGKCSFIGVFASVLSGLMCGLLFCVGVKGGIPQEKPGILLAELTFTVLSAIYFFLKAFGAFAKNPTLSLFGLLPALMCAFMILNLYFNTDEPLNAPLKIYEIVMLVTFMFYFAAETGINILRPKMNRKFVFAGILATASGGMTALSRLAVRIADVDTFKFDIIRCVFCAVIWLCIIASYLEKLLRAREIKEDDAFFDNENDADGEKDEKEDGKIPFAEPDEAEEAVEEAEEAVEETVEEAEETAGDAVEEAEETVEETVEEAVDKAEEAAEEVSEEISEEISDAASDSPEEDKKTEENN